jgi:hypothetical protein
MKKLLLILTLCILYPTTIEAMSLPCSLPLEVTDKDYIDAQGSALLKTENSTNLSVLGINLPDPETLGDYDSYEGFAFIPDVVSWNFRLHPTKEANSSNWIGSYDVNVSEVANIEVQIRLSNSRTDNKGPVILTNNTKYCKKKHRNN